MSTFGTRSSFRVSSGAKAVKGLEKSTREVLEAEKENHSIQSRQLKNRLVRVHCSHGGDRKMIWGGGGGGTIRSRDPPLNSHHAHGVSDSEGSEVEAFLGSLAM